jgi:putative cardiolipin synthase
VRVLPVIADSLAEELAAIAGELTTTQVRSWVDVLSAYSRLGPDVEAALVSRTLGAPSTTARRLVTAWRDNGPELPGAAVALALLSAGQVHAEAENRRPSLVVSGPNDYAAPTRFTRPAAREVVSGSKKTLIIVSFATHGMEDLIEELHAAADRQVSIDFVLESLRREGGTLNSRSSGESVFASLRGRANFWRWPREQRLLQRDTTRDSRAALHAKIIAADKRTALVSSANLTDRAYTRNLEIGVILRDPDAVGRLDEHFRRLIDNGTLELCPEPEE